MAQRENSKKRIREWQVSGLEINVWFNDTVSKRFEFLHDLFVGHFAERYSPLLLFFVTNFITKRLPRQCCEPNRNWVVYESRDPGVENFPVVEKLIRLFNTSNGREEKTSEFPRLSICFVK